jgi:hypothetical protein
LGGADGSRGGDKVRFHGMGILDRSIGDVGSAHRWSLGCDWDTVVKRGSDGTMGDMRGFRFSAGL